MRTFPDGFLWGAATSAYQVEGANIHNDWWEWEEKGRLKYRCGDACRHYELFKTDFELARSLNHNAHRLSIEWSRVEPEEGRFRAEEIEHYARVIDTLKGLGLEPVVTLHHFTNPLWYSKKGGWLAKDGQKYFLRYVEKIVGALSGRVRYWVTINEPMVYGYYSYVAGIWPPQERSLLKLRSFTKNIVSCHIASYKLIHALYRKAGLASPLVSIAHNVKFFEPRDGSFRNRLAVILRNRIYNFGIIDEMARAKALDFIGLNYYTRAVAEVKSWKPLNLLTDVFEETGPTVKKNTLGWDIYPRGLYELCVRFKKYGIPLFILENGICTLDDGQRWDFIREHIEAVRAAIRDGVKIMGYLYWSLLDNFEWHEGFGPRFGLIEVDYSTYKRTVRESAVKFARICETGGGG